MDCVVCNGSFLRTKGSWVQFLPAAPNTHKTLIRQGFFFFEVEFGPNDLERIDCMPSSGIDYEGVACLASRAR